MPLQFPGSRLRAGRRDHDISRCSVRSQDVLTSVIHVIDDVDDDDDNDVSFITPDLCRTG